MEYRITQPIICSVMRGTLGDDVYVDGICRLSLVRRKGDPL